MVGLTLAVEFDRQHCLSNPLIEINRATLQKRAKHLDYSCGMVLQCKIAIQQFKKKKKSLPSAVIPPFENGADQIS